MAKKKYLLQFGLAFVLIYASVDALLHPVDWVGFIPAWTENFGISQGLALHLHAALQIILGLALLLNYKVKTISLIVAINIAVLMAVNGFSRAVFTATFRDVAIFFMALYLGIRGRY